MNRLEMGKIFKLLSATYEWFDANDTFKLKLWLEMLSDINTELLNKVVMEWICYEKKPPTIPYLRVAIVQKINKFPSAEEAWQICYKPRAQQTEEVKKALEHIGGRRAINTSTMPELLRSQFIKAYNNIVEKETRHQCEKNRIGKPSYLNGADIKSLDKAVKEIHTTEPVNEDQEAVVIPKAPEKKLSNEEIIAMLPAHLRTSFKETLGECLLHNINNRNCRRNSPQLQ